jgi:hypothetical protein
MGLMRPAAASAFHTGVTMPPVKPDLESNVLTGMPAVVPDWNMAVQLQIRCIFRFKMDCPFLS